MRPGLFLALSTVLPAMSHAIVGQAQEVPPEAMKVLQHQVGHWDVRNDVPGPDGSVVRVTAERHDAAFVINGTIVEVHGFIEGHEDFRGFIMFNPSTGRFLHSTIDRSNNHVDMHADLASPYHLTSSPFSAPDGSSVTFRRVLTSVEPDRMEGYAEISADGGKTWRRVFNQVMTRTTGGTPDRR